MKTAASPLYPGWFTRRHSVIGGAVAVLWVFNSIPLLRAEEPPKAPEKPAPGSGLSAGELEERIKTIEERTDLDEGTKSKLLDHYRQALDLARIAEGWSAKAAEFEAARLSAPQRLESIKTELAAPSPEAKAQVPQDASLQQLEHSLAQQEADLKALQAEAAALEEERKTRGDRRSKIPQETAAARQKLAELQVSLEAPPPSDENSLLTEARQALLTARKQALEQELAAYEQETQSYDARGELLTARRDLVSRRIANKEALVNAWREIVNERRRKEAEGAAREAQRTARRQAALGRPAVKRLAQANAQLAKRRTESGIADKIEQANREIDAAEKARTQIASDLKSIRARVEKVGLTKAMGLQLRNRLDTLPSEKAYADRARVRSDVLAELQLEIIEVEEDRSDLANIEPKVTQLLSELDPATPDDERAEIESTMRDLFKTRRDLLDSLINDLSTYRDKLFQLEATEAELLTQIEHTRDYILELILWVPSTSPPRREHVAEFVEGIRWLLAPSQWQSVGSTFLSSFQERKVRSYLALPMILGLIFGRYWLTRRLRKFGQTAGRSSTQSIVPTLRAIVITMLLAMRWPVLMLFGAWLLSASIHTPPFAESVAEGLRVTALFFALAALIRSVCRSQGLADSHFELSEGPVRTVRRSLFGLMAVSLPPVFVLAAVEHQADAEFWSTVGRLAFVIIHAALFVFVLRTHRAVEAIVREATHTQTGGWLDRLRYIWVPLAMGLPILLIGLALAGYYYTALRLAVFVQETVWMAVGFLLLDAFLLRWLLVERRRLAIEQYRKQRAAALAAAQSAADPALKESAPEQEPEPALDLSAIGAQTRTLVHSLVAFGLVAGLWIVWANVLPALGILERVELWHTTQAVTETVASPDAEQGVTVSTIERVVPITLADLGLAGLILVITFIGLRNVPGLLEIAILQRLPLQASIRYAVTTLARYVISILGLVFAFGAIGINWSKVQWLAAAITVGLGFGLQEIFANFVSGLIILFERPIRVGDIVTVGNTTGKIARIQMRATTILDWDNLELIVPNKDLITTQVVNWTLTDAVTRVMIPVGIAYGSDTEKARELLLKVAEENPLVMKDPAPWAIFRGFGDSALDLVLYIYLATRDVWRDVMHSMHTGIDQAFRQAGIEIAFPQRDLHIRTISGSLRLRNGVDAHAAERKGQKEEV